MKETARERIHRIAATIGPSNRPLPKTTLEQLYPLFEKVEAILNQQNKLLAEVAEQEPPEVVVKPANIKVDAPAPARQWDFQVNRSRNGLIDNIVATRVD